MDYKFINTEYLESVSGGDKEIIHELIKMFIEQASEVHDEMLTLFDSQDYLALGLLAHKAKSSVAIMGMNDLSQMLKTFELQAKNEQKPELYGSYIKRFKTDTEAAFKELDHLAKTL